MIAEQGLRPMLRAVSQLEAEDPLLAEIEQAWHAWKI
jgi:hypothetical protein